MKLGEPVRVYLNHPAPCPYLPGLEEQRILIPLAEDFETAQEQASFFTRLGFRRSQNMLYRPQCPSCMACQSLRIVVDAFQHSETQARVVRRNNQFVWQETSLTKAATILYPLFHRYQQARHSSSDMAQFTEEDFHSLLAPAASGNTCFTLIDPADGQVIGAILADRTADGYSAVYSFYDPAYTASSLGTELVLRLVGQARADTLPYIYLGYWVRDCSKMSYKNKFRPAEILGAEGWTNLAD